MRSFEGKVAVITGAASGIGQALAHRLADAGARLALSDIDADGLAATAATCQQRGADVHQEVVDVADRTAVLDHARTVVDHYGTVNLVVNNAGVALAANAVDQSFEDIDWLLGINLYGVINGTQAFLPHLIASGDGHLVNLSSIFGMVGVPTQSAYNAAKFGVRGYTEAVAIEMAAGNHPVGVTCVHPGGIATNIARSARKAHTHDHHAMGDLFDRLAMTTPDKAAAIILRGVTRNKRRVLVGADAVAISLATRLLGSYYQPVVGRVIGGLFDRLRVDRDAKERISA